MHRVVQKTDDKEALDELSNFLSDSKRTNGEKMEVFVTLMNDASEEGRTQLCELMLRRMFCSGCIEATREANMRANQHMEQQVLLTEGCRAY